MQCDSEFEKYRGTFINIIRDILSDEVPFTFSHNRNAYIRGIVPYLKDFIVGVAPSIDYWELSQDRINELEVLRAEIRDSCDRETRFRLKAILEEDVDNIIREFVGPMNGGRKSRRRHRNRKTRRNHRRTRK